MTNYLNFRNAEQNLITTQFNFHYEFKNFNHSFLGADKKKVY